MAGKMNQCIEYFGSPAVRYYRELSISEPAVEEVFIKERED